MIYYLQYLKDITGNNYLGLNIYTDTIVLFLDELKDIIGSDEYIRYTKLQKERDQGKYHITFINVSEFNKLSKDLGISNFVNSLEPLLKYEIDDLKMMGIGLANRNENKSYFIVCQSDKLEAMRDRYELPKLDFHITIGFLYKDVHGIRKNEVLEKGSKLLKLLKIEYYKNDNFEFIKKIDNYDQNPDLEIIPIDLMDNILRIKVGNNILDIGYIEDNRKLRIVSEYSDNNDVKRIPVTEIIEILK